MNEGKNPQTDPTVNHQESIAEELCPFEWFGLKIVGDNVAKSVKPRLMQTDRQNQSFHYFHLYAVRDRINLTDTSETSHRIQHYKTYFPLLLTATYAPILQP